MTAERVSRGGGMSPRRVARNVLIAVAITALAYLLWQGRNILGVPAALALALIAGVFEFVPIIGPIAAAVPAIAVIFGFLGLLLAVPILAVVMVAVDTLYVEPMEKADGVRP